MPRFKNDKLDEILKNAEPVDWEKHYEEEKKRKQQAALNKELERIAEARRVDNLQCPVCNSIDKNIIRKTNSNGVYGPGSRSWVTEEYIICTNCGVMYKDINRGKENNG